MIQIEECYLKFNSAIDNSNNTLKLDKARRRVWERMKKASLAIVLVVLLVCSFVSQVSVVVPEMSEPENVDRNKRREDRLECLGYTTAESSLLSLEDEIVERRTLVANRFHKESLVTAVSTASPASYENDDGLWRETNTKGFVGRDTDPLVVSNKSGFQLLGGERHARISYFAVWFDQSYAYEEDTCYIEVEAYNDDAGLLGADLYFKLRFYDSSSQETCTPYVSPTHYVYKYTYYRWPTVTKTLGGTCLPYTGPQAQDRIDFELWWDDSGNQRLQDDGCSARFPVLDEDTTGPTIDNLGSTPSSPAKDDHSGSIRIQGDVSDPEGISSVYFGYGYHGVIDFWKSPSDNSGNTYWYDIPESEWEQNVGETVVWRINAYDNDNDHPNDREDSYSDWGPNIEILDDDPDGPDIYNVQVSEYGGNGDGKIYDDEQVKISWSLYDPSGIYTRSCEVDGTPYSVQGSYYIICGPLSAGNHDYEISATDNDNDRPNDRASSSYPDSFTVYRKRELGITHKVQRKDTYMLCLGWGSNGEPFDGQFAWDKPHPTSITHPTGSLLDDKYCARASVSMIASYYGGTLSQDRISYYYFEEWSGSPYRDGKPEGDLGCGSGMPQEEALRWALNWATITHYSGKPSFNQIRSWIDFGRPILRRHVHAQGAHSTVIDGYDTYGERVHVLDPWYTSSEYYHSWWADYGSLNVEEVWVPPASATGRSDEGTIWMDSDGDGVYDFDEIYRFGTNRYGSDTDGDGVNDKEEIISYTFLSDHSYDASDVRRPDPDGDGNRCELDYDSDNGGVRDGLEDLNKNGFVDLGETDPLNPLDDPNAVHLESLEDTGTTTNLGTITFDGSTYSLPNDVSKPAGTYPAQYNPPSGYVFDHWEVSGGVSVADPNAWSTSATITGSGTLRAIYREEIITYTVHLESSQDNATSSNLGTIKFYGSTYSLPSDITKPAGTYPIEYNADPGYVFDHWETTPGITVTNPNAESTTATISGDGTLTAIYKEEMVQGPVHNLDTGLNYTTIQEAIDAPETLGGHTIKVDAGIYYENVVVSKSLTLIGEKTSTTIIDGSYTGTCLKIIANNVNITGFTITENSDGIYLYDSSDNTISGNDITYNWFGISMYNSSSNRISGNNITNNDYGINFTWSSGNTISGNNITNNNSYGIYLRYSSGNSISGNNITNNMLQGIVLDGSSNNTISGNNITNSEWFGILLVESSNNTISGNNITYNSDGIWLDGSSNNTISGNDITNNDYGIGLGGPSNNSIYHNNFVDNTQQVYSYNSTNVWDKGYPYGGNYWSDYNGTDFYSGPYQNETGSDGIGDTPYPIDENNQDSYPLVNPWTPTETSVKVKGKDYPVTIVSNATIDQMVIKENFLQFRSSGPTGEKGYILVIFPTINSTSIRVKIDNDWLTPPPFPVINSNGTHYFIYFEFTLSTHNITIQFGPTVPVGGVWVPVDKFGLLAPYIGLASTILVATAATAIYVKRVKRRKKKQ